MQHSQQQQHHTTLGGKFQPYAETQNLVSNYSFLLERGQSLRIPFEKSVFPFISTRLKFWDILNLLPLADGEGIEFKGKKCIILGTLKRNSV